MIAIIKNKAQHPYALLIRKCRLAKGLNQLEFAERIGYTKSMVCRWEFGHATPHTSAIDIIRSEFPFFVEYEKKCNGLKIFENDFSDSIRAFCKYKHICRTVFAEIIGVDYNIVSNWVYGRTIPTYEHIKAINKAFPDFEEWEANYETD